MAHSGAEKEGGTLRCASLKPHAVPITDLFVAPITAAVDNDTQLATRSMWLPPGPWVNTATGTIEEGNATIIRSYTMWEVPLFVRAGFVQPLTPPVTQGTVTAFWV